MGVAPIHLHRYGQDVDLLHLYRTLEEGGREGRREGGRERGREEGERGGRGEGGRGEGEEREGGEREGGMDGQRQGERDCKSEYYE